MKQQVVKNGLMLDVPVPGVKTMYLNGFFIDTRFLENVAVDAYQTVGGGLSLRGPKVSLNMTFGYDYADLFDGWHATLGLGWGH